MTLPGGPPDLVVVSCRIPRVGVLLSRLVGVALGCLLVLTGCGGETEERARAEKDAANAPQNFDRYGIAFEHPSEWSVTTRPLSDLMNPVYRFAVSSVPVQRTGADEGPCLPGIARQLPSHAVLAYLIEALGHDRVRSLPRMAKRPHSFRLPTQADDSLCGWERRGLWLPFKDKGRAFYLGVYVGPQAAVSTRRALSRLLDGMRILEFDPEQLDLDPLAPPTCTKVWSETEIATWLDHSLAQSGYKIVRRLPASLAVRHPSRPGSDAEPVVYLSAVGAPSGPVAWDEHGVVTTVVGGTQVAYTSIRVSWFSASGQFRVWVETAQPVEANDLAFFEPLVKVTSNSDPESPC